MPYLTWRHRSIWPSWPRSCSRYSGATPSSGSRGPTAKESTSCREEGWTQSKASGQARAKEATENVAWDGDQPVERQKGRAPQARASYGTGAGGRRALWRRDLQCLRQVTTAGTVFSRSDQLSLRMQVRSQIRLGSC